jgi:hypothetical protein
VGEQHRDDERVDLRHLRLGDADRRDDRARRLDLLSATDGKVYAFTDPS